MEHLGTHCAPGPRLVAVPFGANMTFLVDFVFLLLAAGGGAAAAAFIAWLRAGQAAGARSQAEAAHFARETLARLQDLTRRVAAEVDQHAVCVEEINAQLSSDDADEGA